MTTAATLDRVLTVAEVAKRLSCGTGSVYRLISDGDLAAFRVGRLLRVRESALSAFMGGPTEGAF